ncbi:hypothetical protein K7432_015983 [Basidiobolus ranarum]|uniref:Tag1-like fifth Ig-like domain-containing protein n=1 Tax=Basidiobolus ranarum TaxID=34480 RepID=A0ABR2VMA6_9FUNG
MPSSNRSHSRSPTSGLAPSDSQQRSSNPSSPIPSENNEQILNPNNDNLGTTEERSKKQSDRNPAVAHGDHNEDTSSDANQVSTDNMPGHEGEGVEEQSSIQPSSNKAQEENLSRDGKKYGSTAGKYTQNETDVDTQGNTENTPLLGDASGSGEHLSELDRIRQNGRVRDLPKEYAESIQKWWQNLRPLWRWIIIALAILIAQLLLFALAIRLIGPSATEDILRAAKLTFESTTISELRPLSFLVTANASISNLPDYALISEPTTLDVLYHDRILGKINIPETTLGPSSNWFMIDSPLYTQDPELFSDFATELMTSESLTWSLVGNLSLRARGSRVENFPFRKDIGLKGLKGIRDLTMLSLDLSAHRPDGDVHLDTVISLFNPSNVTLYPGDIPFGIFYEQVKLAQVSTKSITLAPGPNNITLSGKIFPYSEDDIEIVSEFVTRYLKGEKTLVNIRGLGAYTTVPWLVNAIQGIQASVPVSGWSDRAFISDVKLQELSSEFFESKQTPIIGGSIQAKVKLPTSFPMEVKYISQYSEVCVYQHTIGEKGNKCIPFAKLALLSIPVKNTIKGDLITISADFRRVPLVPLKDKELFNYVVKRLFISDKGLFGISGETTVSIETTVGIIDLDLSEFERDFTLIGLSDLQNRPPVIKKTEIVNKKADLTFESEVKFYNPGKLISSWGTLMFDIVSDGINIGQIIVPELRMNPGENYISCVGRLFVTDDEQVNSTIRSLFNNYISGAETTFSVVGNEHSTEIPMLLDTFRDFSSVFTIPGSSSDLISNSVFHMMFGTFTTDIQNPMQSAPLTIKYVSATVFIDEEPIAQIDTNLQDSWWLAPMVLPPGKSIKTPKLPLVFNSAGYKQIRESLDKTLAVEIVAQVLVEVNEVEMWLDYQEDGVPVLLDGWLPQN